MKQITKLNKETCPQTFAHITSMMEIKQKEAVVFKGLIWEATIGGEIWNVALSGDNPQFVNTWSDSDFGFNPSELVAAKGYEARKAGTLRDKHPYKLAHDHLTSTRIKVWREGWDCADKETNN